VAQPLGGAVGAAENRGLGQGLRLCGGRRQGRGLNDPGEHRRAGARVQQVVGRTAVAAEPAAPGDAAGGHRAPGQREGVQALGAERPGDVDRAWHAGAPANPQVARAVEHVGVKALEQARELVSEHALGDAPDVQAQTRRPAHGPGARVHADPAPALIGMRLGGSPGRGQCQRRGQVDSLPVEVALVSGQLDLVGQRDVDQPLGVAGRLQRGLDDPPHERGDGDDGGGIAIEPAQLAVALKA